MVNARSTAETRGWLFTGWRGGLVGAIAVCMCLLAIVSAIDAVRLAGWFGPGRGDLGLQFHAVAQHPGWSRVDSVSDSGAAQAAGIAPAMFVRFDQAYVAHAELLIGREVGLRVATGDGFALDHARHLILIARPDAAAARAPYKALGHASVVFASWFCVVLGIVVLVRGWGSLAALTFGLGIFAFPLLPVVPTWAIVPWQGTALVLACAVTGSAGIGLMLLPAALYCERIGRPRTPWLLVFGAIGLTVLVARVLWGLHGLDEPRFALIGDKAEIANLAVQTLSLVLGLFWAWRGTRDARGADRGRFIALLAANVVVVIISVANAALDLPPTRSAATIALLYLAQQTLTNVLLPLVLAYAVLRHRVVDLGFVLNRTIVFGSISALLLGCFGLIEWGVEHWLPESWVKASVWIDAGAALLVYLAFHRVHEAVENRVEHVFFRGWHANEAILRRFVASAPHFEDERALARSFADELSRFSGDARVALYRRRDRTHDSILERMAGSWDTAPRTLPVDDPAFALMRAERRAIDLSDTLTDLPGVLALPMLDHGVLSGLVLMDLKGPGALYRPDEVDVLGWAAHDVALAMAALHAGQIEAENRLLKAQLARLGSLIGDRLDHAEI
ncbi:hypothetical protein [Novosphingobium sp.]|uniref:hypothetical protein n=1 Tax=Novosphingobium sp. TaxID=1874826 RepID=UPI003D1019A6